MLNGSKGLLSRLIAALALACSHLPAFAQVSYFSVGVTTDVPFSRRRAPPNLRSER